MKKRYPQYRKSGIDPALALKPSQIDWIGQVPVLWQIKKLKYVATINDDVVAEDEDPLREILYVDIGSIHPSIGMTSTEEMILEDAPTRARRLVQDGDTIVSTVRTYLRAVAPVRNPPPEMVVSTGFAVIRPRDVDRGYCSWALREHRFIEEVVANSNGVSYPAINASQIGELSIAVPRMSEQRHVAAFLDRETARIDQLIARYELLIERLAEYRNSVITRAVTKGLPPDAAHHVGLDPEPCMKSSASDWIGDVPEHWDVKKLKQSATRTNIKAETEELEDITYIGLENVRPWVGSIEEMDDPIEPEGTANVFQPSDILFGKLRPYLAKGLLADKAGVCSTEFLVFTPTNYEGQYLLYLILTKGFIQTIDSSTFGAKMPRTNWDFIGNQNLPVPPKAEQQAIAQYLDQKIGRIDSLSERAGTAIERLNEYRAALITAAVTGKIDVRESAAAEEPTE